MRYYSEVPWVLPENSYSTLSIIASDLNSSSLTIWSEPSSTLGEVGIYTNVIHVFDEYGNYDFTKINGTLLIVKVESSSVSAEMTSSRSLSTSMANSLIEDTENGRVMAIVSMVGGRRFI